MSKFLRLFSVFFLSVMAGMTFAQQVPNSDFEDWSAAAFDGQPQAKGWNASNVEQVGMKFNFAHREAGHTGSYSYMVQDQSVGAMGITETSPGYVSLGQPWAYLPSITQVNQATAGTEGGISWTHRPDTMSVWIKRTGSNWSKEDFYLLYYSWIGTAKGDNYKGKNGSCTKTSRTNEESDIRQAVNHNECGTTTKVTQVAEGMWRERAQYGSWVNIRVPIYYMSNDAPTMMNIIFSASNYPNYRANDGLYEGNSLYVDDLEMIYSASIQKLIVGEDEWKGFNPNTSEVQYYPLGENATSIPKIEAIRGAGTITNAKGETARFPGRTLTGSEITITNGDLTSKPTVITVKSTDGKSTKTYKIQFQKAASSNTKLAGIHYVYKDKTGKNVIATIDDFNATKTSYSVELPYGTTAAPLLVDSLIDKQESGQKIALTQATSVTGSASIVVTAPNGKNTATYTIKFSVGKLADNTLKGITVNGKDVPGFTPSQLIYKISLPVGTTKVPDVKAISYYPAGEQTIEITLPTADNLNGGQAQIKVTTPGNQTPKVYKLNFKLEASSYSYLKNLKVGDYITNFEPEKLTYYVNLPLGTTSLPKIEAERGDEYQAEPIISSLGEGVVDGTVRVTATAANGDQTVYKIVFSTTKSDNSSLKAILVDGKPIPGFSPEMTTYVYALPVGTTTMPTIGWTPGDEYQTITLTTAGLNGKSRLMVTAGDGSTTIYQITFSVQSYTNNTLKALYVGGQLIEGFEPEKDEYWVNLEQGVTELPEVTYELQSDEFQSATPRGFKGLNGDYKITVRPQSGASRTYIIHFSVATSSNTKLKMLYVGGVPLEGFDPEVLDYTYQLPEGVSTIPAVTFDKDEESQRVLNLQENRVQTITVTAESGAKRVYTITFQLRVSKNAFLEAIYVDGKALEGFRKDSLTYTYQMVGERCPAITVDKAPGQQVTITAPYGAGLATIKVKPEAGEANTYSIEFVPVAAASVRLLGILVNGNAISGFEPTKMNYEAEYEKTLPEVTAVKDNDSQKVQVLWKGNVAWIHVSDAEGNKAAYSVTFTQKKLSNNQLEAIYADGNLIEGFQPNVTSYNYSLQPGSVYPEISYKAADNTQVLFFGQLAEGQWGITVMAENGDKATYTVTYTITKYSNATLKNLEVAGKNLPFEPNTFNYELNLDEGALLPQLTVETYEGQTVYIDNVDDTHQEVIVFAESGNHNTYKITYARQISSNALLADILIDGVSMEGFDPMVTEYTDSLDRKDGSGKLTSVVPNIFPVGQNNNQTITTYFSKPNGTTKIHVEAQNGTTKDYFIAFPVRKSNNNFLGDLFLNTEDAEIAFKPSKTDYIVTLPYEATECPTFTVEKGEPEQRIDIISRPIGETTQIIVIAENGEARTYNILFKREVLKSANVLKTIRIKETGAMFSDEKKFDYDINLPFGSRTMTVEYTKNYSTQTVFVEPGGVNHPTIITVKANNDTVKDVTYTLTPIVPTADPAVVTDIKVNDVTIPGFTPEKFSYIVPVTTKPVLRYEVADGVRVNVLSQTSKHWEAAVTVGDRTNVYNVWFYYTNEQVPNMEFNEEFVACDTYTSAKKPKGWNTNADAVGEHKVASTFKPTELCAQNSSPSDAVRLQTIYSSPGGGYIPGFITLGKVKGTWGVAGSTAFGISGGIKFHNSPDEFILTYTLDKVNQNTLFQYELTGMDGVSLAEWTETATGSYTKRYPLADVNNEAGEPVMVNITLCSYHQVDGTIGNALDKYTAKLTIDKIAFTYNHTLTGMKVDAFNITPSGNNFTATLTDPERIELPVLSFTGEVADQAQDVDWSAPKAGADADADYELRKASIRNWAENGTDYTDYQLTVKRPYDHNNKLSDLLIDGASIMGFAPDKTDYTVTLSATRRNLPDLMPVPGSSLQTVTNSFDAATSTMTITVTPEKGDALVYTVHFETIVSDDTTLANIVAEGITYAADQDTYEITAAQWPIITFVKNSDLQQVSLINGVITVTAEDGVNTGTYTIVRKDPTSVTTGTIKEFSLGMNVIVGFGGTDTEWKADKPAGAVLFERDFASDEVVFTQSPTKMQWDVKGSSNTTYTWLYPVELSDNATLANILLNGAPYAEFLPAEGSYEITSDTTVVISAVAAEVGQTLTSSLEPVDGGVEYTTEVTAADGQHSKTYKVRVVRPMSDDATLAAILLDDALLDGFDPLTDKYEVTLPVGAVKTVQPKMPNITHVVGHKGQKVTVEYGELNGKETVFNVESEDGTQNARYELTINAEPSHCVDLTGITVNGVSVDQFEPGRHYYSQSLKISQIEIDWTADDRFLEVEIEKETIAEEREYRYTLHVTAEDGVRKANYEVMIYVENQSNDAQLANITLDGKDFDDFYKTLNEDLFFDGGNNNYEINLPAGTTILPEVTAQLKMDGQSVVITQKKDSILLDVTAMDGSTNQYALRFFVPLSKNADLGMIYLDGDSLPNFEPTYYFYQVDLPVGIHTMPEVAAQKGESSQTITSIEMDDEKFQATIKVQAEDPKVRENTYVVVFHTTMSDEDKLEMIYQDGQQLEGFRSDSMYYTKSLPVGTTAFPALAWQEVDDWQKIHMDTVDNSTPGTLVRQIIVESESGKKSTYTVSYTIEKSSIDTLQAVFINQKQLLEFNAYQDEYRYTLTASEAADLNGMLPKVEYIAGDEYQTVMISQAPDSLESKSLGYKSLITVTAASGKTRTYTIHYPVEKSSDATLNMIMLSGKPIVGFDAERLAYRLEVEFGADLPLVSVVKKEDVQVYDIRFSGDSIYVDVTAENGLMQTYSLIFERRLSANAKLADLLVNGHDDVRFRPDEYDYFFRLPFGEDTIPTISWILQDSLQTVPDSLQMDTLESGNVVAMITVVAPNKEDEATYTLTFQFDKNGDNSLLALYIDTTLVEGFDSRLTEYVFQHPFGSDSTAFFGIDKVHYELSDSLAKDSIYIDELGTIYISVTAQNGNENIYTIAQTIGLDNDNALSAILIAGDTIRGFDPDILSYTYFVPEGSMPPELQAIARSANAEEPKWREVQAGDTCFITVRAQDQSERKYAVHFAISTLNEGLEATSEDVLIKRVPGTYQIFIGTIRAGVTFALYDQFGTPFFREPIKLTPADVNDAEIILDAEDKERLNDIYNTRSGMLIELEPGRIYLYGFYGNSNKKTLKSGKMRIIP